MNKQADDMTNSYWNNPQNNPEYIGVYPIGTGQDVEIPYRHHYEWEQFKQYLPQEAFKILELGCGAGRWGFSLAPYVSHYVGVDISADQIALAQERAAQQQCTQLSFVHQNIMTYETLPDSLDVVYFSGVSQYIQDDAFQTLLERAQVWLKPGGVLIDRSSTYVGKQRYVRNENNYFCIYRLSAEIIECIHNVGFTLLKANRSYPFLRDSATWSNPELCTFVKWGMAHKPDETFALMRAWSEHLTAKIGPYAYEGDKTYDHRFFFFKKT